MIDGIIEEFHFYMIWDVMLSPDHPKKIIWTAHVTHLTDNDLALFDEMNLIPIDAGLYPGIEDLQKALGVEIPISARC